MMPFPTSAFPIWKDGAPDFNPDFNQPQPTLTPFKARNREGVCGSVIVFPGGGYQCKAPHEAAPIAEMLANEGLNAFVLDYRVSPYTHPVPLMDAQRAIRLVRYHAADWGILPDKIAILGFSAGGHLCAHAGTCYDGGNPESHDPVERVSCRPDAFIPCYAVMSATAYSHEDSFRRLTGKDELTAMEKRLFSPDQLVTDDTPPAFLWHTAEDELVPVENSLLMAAALSNHHRPFALHVFPYGCHGIGLGEKTPLAGKWGGLCADFLKQLGF